MSFKCLLETLSNSIFNTSGDRICCLDSLISIFSNSYSEEAHEVFIIKWRRNMWIQRIVSLSEFSYSVEKKPGIILFFFSMKW